MTVVESRRITGPTLVLDRPGAVLDVQLEEPDRTRAIAAWRRSARSLLDGVGWNGEQLGVRLFPGGASLGFSAPLDALYAATDMNEWAWDQAVAALRGEPEDDVAQVVEAMRERLARESNPALLRLRDAAPER